MHNGGYNTNRLTIRGMGSRDPYGSNRVKAYLNDIPISGGDGVTVIEDLSLSGIQRVEILKGPSSALFGAGLGGTLRLFTPYRGGSGFGINTMHQTGSYGLQKHALNTHFKKGNTAISLDLGRQQSEGYRENSGYNNNHILLNGDLFLRKMQVGLLISYINLKAHIPSSLDETTFMLSPSSAAAGWLAIQGFEKYSKFLAGVSVSSDFTRNLSQKTTFFTGGRALYESRPFNILEDNTSNFGLRNNLKYEREGLVGMAGLEFFAEAIDWSTFETQSGEKGALQQVIRENRYYINLFNLYKWSLGESFIIEAGWNLGLVRFNLAGSDNPDYPVGKHDFSPVISPRIAGNYNLGRHISLFGSAGHGFSTPSFEETLLPEGIRNNELKPEKGWNFELGARGDLIRERLTYDVSTYMILIKNLLVTKRISEEIFTGVNAGRSIHYGLESQIQINILHNNPGPNQLYLSNAFQYSLNRFRTFFSDSVDYSSNHLPGIPVYKNHLRLTWRGPLNLESDLSFLLVGRQYLADDNNNVYNSYQVTNLNIGWSPEIADNFGIVIAAGLDNVFDRSYASMILINAPSFGGADPRYYYPGMPRYFYIQLRMSLN
jgi:iron complex outermembrane receptor protein